jgi:hypothetical protein
MRARRGRAGLTCRFPCPRLGCAARSALRHAHERVRSLRRRHRPATRVLDTREADRAVATESTRSPFTLLLVALARDVLENDRRQYAVKAVPAAVHCEPPGEVGREGCVHTTPPIRANPRAGRLCTSTLQQATAASRTNSRRNPCRSGTGRIAEHFSPATCVQLRPNPSGPMELLNPNVCIAGARVRASAEYADDAINAAGRTTCWGGSAAKGHADGDA